MGIVGSSQGYESDKDNFGEKYLGKNFTKEDLANPEIFDINEVSNHIRVGMYAYNYKTVNLIRVGMDIVNENDNFSLRFHNRLGPASSYGVPTIYLNSPNRNWEVNYANAHIEDVIILKTTLNDKENSYVFNHLSQVKLYFDTRREFARS